VDAYARADERRSVYYPRNASAPLAALASNLCDGEGMSYVLSTVGGKVLESLEKDLRGKDAAARVAACKHLGQMGRTLLMHQEGPEMVERIVKALLPLIKHEDGDVREALAVNMPVTKSSTPGVEELQRDRDIKVGHAARMTLMAYGVDDAMPRLFDLLKKAPSAEQLRAAEALLHSEEALTVVWDALKSKDPALKHHAAYIIGARQALGKRTWEEVNEMVAPILVASLKSNDPLKRREAAEGLEKWGIQLDSVHVPAFVAAIKDKDAKVRFAAIYVLRSHSGEPHAKTVLPAVEPFLTDPDFDTRIAAVHVFGNSGAPGLPRLLEAFAKEKDAVTRLYMIRTFQQQSGDQRVYDALLKAAENPEDWPEASQALFRSQEKKAFPKLIELMCKKDEAMRKTFADLPEQTWTAVSAAKAVAPLLKKDDIDVNRRAAQTLEQLTPFLMADSGWWVPPIQQALGERLPKVRSLLQSKNPKARLAAVTLLVQFKSMQQFLHQHVHNRPSNDPKLRVEVVDRYQTNQQTISTLLLMARYDAELAVRRMARKSMLSDIMPVTPWGFP
jgi:HEAT repeat protein